MLNNKPLAVAATVFLSLVLVLPASALESVEAVYPTGLISLIWLMFPVNYFAGLGAILLVFRGFLKIKKVSVRKLAGIIFWPMLISYFISSTLTALFVGPIMAPLFVSSIITPLCIYKIELAVPSVVPKVATYYTYLTIFAGVLQFALISYSLCRSKLLPRRNALIASAATAFSAAVAGVLAALAFFTLVGAWD